MLKFFLQSKHSFVTNFGKKLKNLIFTKSKAQLVFGIRTNLKECLISPRACRENTVLISITTLQKCCKQFLWFYLVLSNWDTVATVYFVRIKNGQQIITKFFNIEVFVSNK